MSKKPPEPGTIPKSLLRKGITRVEHELPKGAAPGTYEVEVSAHLVRTLWGEELMARFTENSEDGMITPELITKYKEVMGYMGFTLCRVGADRQDQVAEMMRAAIRGERGPITDHELGQAAPPNAET